MFVKFILPALTEARGKYWRPIKYSLFPPLGLVTLASYLDDSDKIEIVDEHVEELKLDDSPDLVAIETYITSAKRAYKIADTYRERKIPVIMGGLHVTSCPKEAIRHADIIMLGPAEEAWPRFLADFKSKNIKRVYRSHVRNLNSLPPLRRDLIKRKNYLVPNSIVVSRGCPHMCDFCYTNSFFSGGKSFYTCTEKRALSEIGDMPGRHLFFLDDNIFADINFASALFEGMLGRKRIWQGATTVQSVLNTKLLDLAVKSGLRSLFIGFESLNQESMSKHNKNHNKVREYNRAVKLLHERGVMINGSFVFGLDGDGKTVFDTTTEWAVSQGVETATFHILTPYPGTRLFRRYRASGRILHQDWDLYDTRHAVFSHPKMSGEEIEKGYWSSYKKFYKWRNIASSAFTKMNLPEILRHILYVGAWKKFDPFWALLIELRKLNTAVPVLEKVLNGSTQPSNNMVLH